MKGRLVEKFLIVILLLVGLNSDISLFGQNLQVMAFWNLENYFDPFDDELTADEEFTPDGERHWSWKRFVVKRNLISKVLISMKDSLGDFPVIVGFAEVENRFVLEQLVRNTPLVKLGYKVIHYNSADRRGIDVALIYREDFFIPLEQESIGVSFADSTSTRDILRVKGVLKMENCFYRDTVELYVVHFPSKWGSVQQSSQRRNTAAKALLDAVGSSDSENIIVMGDFNDTPDSKIFTLLGEKFYIAGSSGCYTQKGTIKYKGSWELIDNFLITPQLAQFWKFNIFSSELLLERDSQYLGQKPKRTYIGPRYNSGVSDHLPVYIVRKW
ncbi:MAG: hypothetical protein IKC17_06365 [Bacteroidales bacterium]|nr:hypothetical protein [Bacteroidales bacterium]